MKFRPHPVQRHFSAITLVAIKFPKKESKRLFFMRTPTLAAQMHFMHDRFSAELVG